MSSSLTDNLEKLIELKIESKQFVNALAGINAIYEDDIVTDEEGEKLKELHVILADAKSKLDKIMEYVDNLEKA
ncbi:MAG: hypothetical protein KC800_00585 [Candidatus Eremiobacteraeota bacterium]|nr:hypothetical protein [Candidatus Eremiobacteraeota bacterium]